MIYYSHVNEDSLIERQLLSENQYATVVAVVGSGERVLALMDNQSVKTLRAVDVNEEAIYLLQLKIAVLMNASVEDYLKFIGHLASNNGFRNQYFEKVKSQLTPRCIQYWYNKRDWIQKGILNMGHFESFLTRLRPIIVHFLGKPCLQSMLESGFHFTNLQQIKWKLLTWIFSKKWVYKLCGNKDIAFIGNGASMDHIPEALNFLINHGRASSSFITHLIFKGHLRDMDEYDLPATLQPVVLEKIRDRLVNKELNITYHHADLLEFVKTSGGDVAKSTFYSASDILSFESNSYLLELLRNILSKHLNIVVVRSFLRNRLSPQQLETLLTSYSRVEQFDQVERSAMYQVIAIGK